jgi:hypothetical protein
MNEIGEILDDVEQHGVSEATALAPSGLQHRYEMFAQAMATHGDGKRALGEAGYSTAARWRKRFAILIEKPEIKNRIIELQTQKTVRNFITQDGVLQAIQKIHDEAMASRKFGDALKAVELTVAYTNLFQKDESLLPGSAKATPEMVKRWEKAAAVGEEQPSNVITLVPKTG